MKKITGLIAACLASITTTALAHPGPRIWIGNVNGILTTYSSDDDLNPSIYTPQHIFVGGIDQDSLLANGLLDSYPVPGTGIYATDFPGFQVREDHPNDSAAGGIAFGTAFSFKLAGPMLVFQDQNPIQGAASGIYQTTRQTFGDTGAIPQIGMQQTQVQLDDQGQPELVTLTAVTGDAAVQGYNFLTYNSVGDHGHLIATLLPNGSFPANGTAPGDGPHDVYAVPLVLTAPGYQDSSPFYILYGRDIGILDDGPDQQQFLDALAVAQAKLPLPGDADMDYTLSVDDFLALDHGFVNGLSGWQNGDFNGDYVVNAADYAIIDQSYTQTHSRPSQNVLALPAPEPASLSLLLAASTLLCMKCRPPRPRVL